MRRAAALSLLEVVVSSAILLGLALVLAGSSLTARRAIETSQQEIDLDLQLERVLDQLRRELRQSGWDRAGASMLSAPSPAGPQVLETARPPAAAAPVDLLVYRIRQGPEDTDWSSPITIRAAPYAGGVLRGADPPRNVYQLERIQDGQTVRLLHRLTYARVERVVGSPVLRLRLELSKLGSPSKGSTTASLITRACDERVRLRNGTPPP